MRLLAGVLSLVLPTRGLEVVFALDHFDGGLGVGDVQNCYRGRENFRAGRTSWEFSSSRKVAKFSLGEI